MPAGASTRVSHSREKEKGEGRGEGEGRTAVHLEHAQPVHDLVVRDDALLHRQAGTLDRRCRVAVGVLRVERPHDLVVVLQEEEESERQGQRLVRPRASGRGRRWGRTSVLLTGTLSCTMLPIWLPFLRIVVSCSTACALSPAICLSRSAFCALSSSALSLACCVHVRDLDQLVVRLGMDRRARRRASAPSSSGRSPSESC